MNVNIDGFGMDVNVNTSDGQHIQNDAVITTTTTTDSAMAPFLYDTIPNPFAVTFGDTTITSMQGATIDANETLMGGTAGLPPQSVIYNPVTIIFP